MSAFRKGLNKDKFHLIGHSLGAQLSGVIGRKIISKSNKSQKLKRFVSSIYRNTFIRYLLEIHIFRITGLDSAGPPFFLAVVSFLDQLSHSDAEVVDIIHSDAGLYGQPTSTGTIDFWPNDGMTLQPGCPFRLGIPLSGNGEWLNL